MRATLCLLLAAVALAAPAVADRKAESCGVVREPSIRSALFVLATARADTVLSGPGAVEYASFDSAGLETIHGQRFRLDRLGGDVPPELAAARAAGRMDAVLVPHSGGCDHTSRWFESARWSPPGEQVVADVTLRPRSGWVDGLPTFDTDPDVDTYPRGYGMDEEERATALTPAQVFHLSEVLPTYAEVLRAPFAAYRPLLRWAAANPRLAARAPASGALWWAHDNTLQPCTLAYARHPAAGTYRLTVVVERTDTLRTFARTYSGGNPVCRPPRMRNDLRAVTPRIADTTRLWFFGGSNPASIWAPPPREHDAPRRPVCGGGFVLAGGLVNAAPGVRRWTADLVALDLRECFPDDPRFGGREDAFAAYSGGDGSARIPGAFREEAGGVTFQQAWRVNGRTVLEVFARRIDTRALGDR